MTLQHFIQIMMSPKDQKERKVNDTPSSADSSIVTQTSDGNVETNANYYLTKVLFLPSVF